jgi:hypothetical protein
VVIQCPTCGAAESLEAGTLADEPTIVCRECGETWPAPAPAEKRGKMRRKSEERFGGEVIVAERRSLVTYSGAGDRDAWAAKIEGDYWPEPPRQSRLPMMAAAMAAAFFLAAFFGGREAAVAALPDLAGLYAAIGLPVNLEGFAITEVAAERTPTFAGTRVTVRATVENIGASEQPVPAIAAILYSNSLVSAGTFGFDPPERTLKPGESIPLLMELESAPEQAAEVVVRFKRRGETLAVAGEAQSADP